MTSANKRRSPVSEQPAGDYQLFAAAFRLSPSALAISDAESLTYIDVNDAALSLLGFERNEVIGKSALELGVWVDPDVRHAIAAELTKGEAARNVDVQLRRKDGTTCHVRLSADLVKVGGHRRIISLFEDVSATDALRRSEEQYRTLVETARDMIATVSNGIITSVNPAWERLAGWLPEDTIGQSVARFTHPDDLQLTLQHIQTLMSGGIPPIYELRVARKSGGYLTMEFNAAPIKENGEIVGALGVARDITGKKELEAQLQQAQKLEGIGQLAGGIAHDFNNILNVILNYAEFVADSVRDDVETLKDVREIQRAAERAAELTRQLLIFGRRDMVSPQAIDLNEIVEGIESLLSRTLGEQVGVSAKLAEEVSFVYADPNQIEQVLINLAVNSRDAMPAGGTILIETANAELDQTYADSHPEVLAGNYVCLCVSDTGQGMTKEVMARAIEPFFTTKPKGSGTGLGLATVYGVVKQAGGHLVLYSEPGKGTTVKVYLPVSTRSASTSQAEVPDIYRALAGATILLVEDEDAVREVTRRMLTKAGYEVISASNPDEALRTFDPVRSSIDLLITDVVMPGISGLELAEQLRQRAPSLKTIYMSGYSEEIVARKGELDAPLLSKPFTERQLLRKVAEILAKKPEVVAGIE